MTPIRLAIAGMGNLAYLAEGANNIAPSYLRGGAPAGPGRPRRHILTSSTRRLRARPLEVLFSATGSRLPRPSIWICPIDTPRETR